MLGFFKGKTKEKVICSPCVGNVTPLTEVPDPTLQRPFLRAVAERIISQALITVLQD